MDLLEGKVGEAGSSIANELDRARGGTDKNQNKFDRLHDVMICSPLLGEQFVQLLGTEVRVVRINEPTTIMLIGLPFDQKWRRDATIRVQHMLALQKPREQIIANNPSNYPIYSIREYKDLDDQGMLPRLRWDWVAHPIIKLEYTKILGIKAEEMIVLPMQKVMAKHIERQVSELLNKKGATVNDIIECYEKTYNQYFNTEYLGRVFDRLRQLLRKGE